MKSGLFLILALLFFSSFRSVDGLEVSEGNSSYEDKACFVESLEMILNSDCKDLTGSECPW